MQELIANIDDVSVNRYEGYFEKNLINLRTKAKDKLQDLHDNYGFVEFVLVLTPYIVSSLEVSISSWISGNEISSSITFTIMQLIIAVNVPLRTFSDSLDKMKTYFVAYKCTSKFLELVEEKKPNDCRWDSKNIKVGEITMIDCRFTADDGVTVKIINDIFNNIE